jgi:hypothetical protein
MTPLKGFPVSPPKQDKLLHIMNVLAVITDSPARTAATAQPMTMNANEPRRGDRRYRNYMTIFDPG